MKLPGQFILERKRKRIRSDAVRDFLVYIKVICLFLVCLHVLNKALKCSMLYCFDERETKGVRQSM